ncbi:MAG: GYD domain-containing protein [Pseudomonadota bacterium]
MAKYMLRVKYTAEGAKGLMKDGGSARRSVAKNLAESVGGKIESFHFAFGDTDAFVVAELPDAASAAAIALTVSGSGGATVHTTVLMTPEEVDAASKKSPQYAAPGH